MLEDGLAEMGVKGLIIPGEGSMRSRKVNVRAKNIHKWGFIHSYAREQNFNKSGVKFIIFNPN